MDNLFASYVARSKELIDPLLKKPYHDAASSSSSELARYLYEPLARFIEEGGKRVRPALVFLGCEVCGGEMRDALGPALAVEHFQAAALIHDDIADASLTRHGVPALYMQDGEGLAINDGDTALVESFSSIVLDENLEVKTKQALLQELLQMMRRTLEGQAIDLGWARDKKLNLSPEAYCEMATLKTAYYSAASPLVMGAIVAGATTEQIDVLRKFGLAAGLAFQIHDDLMNIIGDAEIQGKDFRSDFTEGKHTLIVCHALSFAHGEARTELIRLLFSHTSEEDELERMTLLVKEVGALNYAQKQEQAFCEKALDALSNASFPNAQALKILEVMPDFFVNRAS